MKKYLMVLFFLLMPLIASAQWQKTHVLSADDTTTSTTLVASHLSVPVGAYQKWYFHAVLDVVCDSVTGIKVAADIPTSGSIIGGSFCNTTSVTAFKTDPISADATAGAAFVTAAAGLGRLYIDITVTTAGTAGSVIIDFETVTAGKVTIKAGSVIVGQRLQ